MNYTKKAGGFTIPGEAGFEELTLKFASKWKADVIRDSDGTELSEEILKAGYKIYSTICIIRGHNVWAKENMDKLQQSFLVTKPQIATESSVTIRLMDDFYEEQFSVNESLEAIDYWQVFDRTSNCEIPAVQWRYDPVTGNVTIDNITPWHKYSVSFLAYRIWEEIYITDNPYTECAYYQESGKLVVINNSDREQVTTITTGNSTLTVTIDAYDTKIAAI